MLDITGFRFLVPFDEQVISTALTKSNPAWSDGNRFLEKILDFRFYLPSTNEKKRWDLLKKDLASIFPTCPVDQLYPLANALPDNPRRVKGVVRALSLTSNEVNRHGSDEIDWPTILLGSIVRTMSWNAFRVIFSLKTANNFQDVNSHSKKEERSEAILITSDDILNQAGIRKSETSDYESCRLITQLWGNHIHILGYKRILYTLRMMDEPEIFTWREFEDFMARHEDPRTHEDIERSVRKIASAQQRSPAEAATELWSAALAGYQNHLSVAASASLLKSHEEAMAHAANLLRFFDRVISLSPLCTPDQRVHAFEKLLFISLEWAHFRGNTADKAARAAEEKLLNDFLSKAGPNSLDYLAIVESQCREASFHGGIGEARTELCNRIQLTSSVATDIAYDRIISIFTSSSSIGELFQPNQPVRLGELLLDPNGSLWSKSSKNSLLNILKAASQCPNIQVNAM